VKAVNYLLPHIQRIPSRIARDELAREMAQKLGIDSAILGQELRHAAARRTGAQVKAPTEPQVTDAERILIRALASSSEWHLGETHISSREGVEVDFDPARQARFTLLGERLHEGLATESLLEALLGAEDQGDPMLLPLSDADRQLLAGILMREEEELTPELLEGAIEALNRRKMERKRRELQGQITEAERKQDSATLSRLLQEKLALERSLAGPSLSDRTKAS
jgi:DNA primase